MLSTLKKIFTTPAYQAEAYQSYAQIVAQARQPFFYAECEVPDSVDGRFDVIVLHMWLVLERLQQENVLEFVRALQEVFFADMDRALREMGSTDTGTGKRMKSMVQAFYGRMQAYGQAADAQSFAQALKRNLYREKEVAPESIAAIQAYVQTVRAKLAAQNGVSLISGKIEF